jgi:hypothetical protein
VYSSSCTATDNQSADVDTTGSDAPPITTTAAAAAATVLLPAEQQQDDDEDTTDSSVLDNTTRYITQRLQREAKIAKSKRGLDKLHTAAALSMPPVTCSGLGLEESLGLAGLGGSVGDADFVTGLVSLNR